VLYLGVDGGMTKTIALACGADGRISGHARAGSSDVYSASDPELAVSEVARAAGAAIAAAGGGEPACAYYSLSGADWPVDIAYYESELSHRVPAMRTVVVNDAIGAIRCGPDDGVGCSLVCGTGTALGARARDGRVWHMSFIAAPTFTTATPPATASMSVRRIDGSSMEYRPGRFTWPSTETWRLRYCVTSTVTWARGTKLPVLRRFAILISACAGVSGEV